MGSDEIIENNNSDDLSAKKLRESPDAVSFSKNTAANAQPKNGTNKQHKILCQKQSYMIESFDGGQTLRQDN